MMTTTPPIPNLPNGTDGRATVARRLLLGAAALTLTAGGFACASTPKTATSTNAGTAHGASVTLVTHDSFALDKALLAKFEADTGLKLNVVQGGDAGSVVNQAILTKGAPTGDVLFGVDNTLLSKALDAGVFAPNPQAPTSGIPSELFPDKALRVIPVDTGQVCINYDAKYFADKGLPEPKSLDDLTTPAYNNLVVVQNPATSSPGLAFLLATVAKYGDTNGGGASNGTGWQGFWTKLKANNVKVVDGWEQAYNGEFSAGGKDGTKPVVVSYASSPAAEILAATGTPPTSTRSKVLGDGCFQQIEYVGVLTKAKNPTGGAKVADWMVSMPVQNDVAPSMYVYPVLAGAQVPEAFTKFAPPVPNPLTMPPDKIAANRDKWVAEWKSLVLG